MFLVDLSDGGDWESVNLPVRLEPGAADLVLFAEVAAGQLTTDELRERILARYLPPRQG